MAEVIGRNLFELAVKRQVICITHLAQIACYGDRHFVILKKSAKGRTLSRVQVLAPREREEEIARMLAGIQITDRAMAHARELIRNAGGER